MGINAAKAMGIKMIGVGWKNSQVLNLILSFSSNVSKGRAQSQTLGFVVQSMMPPRTEQLKDQITNLALW